LGDDDTVPASMHFNEGSSVSIDTNVYKLVRRQGDSIYQYSIALEPEVLNSKLVTHFVYSALCPEGGPMGGNARWHQIIFDGQRILYSSIPDLDGEYVVNARPGSSDHVVRVEVTRARTISSDDGESLLAIYNTAFR
jgi:hypothetical protein